jgi:hypothetical protein
MDLREIVFDEMDYIDITYDLNRWNVFVDTVTNTKWYKM